MTIRDIQHHLASTIGTELSHETISKITDEVLEAVTTWQRRSLELFYPVIYLDAIVVKVRGCAHVRNKAAHIAIGVDLRGTRWSGCSRWRSATSEDNRARDREKERGKPANERKSAPRLVEGQVTTNWKKALTPLALAYPERIEPYL